MQELHVTPGTRLPLVAAHDTYGISFSRTTAEDLQGPPAGAAPPAVQPGAGSSKQLDVDAGQSTGVPLQVNYLQDQAVLQATSSELAERMPYAPQRVVHALSSPVVAAAT